MSVTTKEMENEKMDLKEFGKHLVEMSKDLKYMGHEMKDSIRKPLDTYLNSTKNKSDVESLCGHVARLLETARLNIDHYIDKLREKILDTEDNTVLQGICKKFETYTVNSKLDRDHNLNRVEVGVNTRDLVLAPENPTTVEGPVYDDRLQQQFKEAEQNATDTSTSDPQNGIGHSQISTVLEEPKEENESVAIVERDGGNIEKVTRVNPDLEQEGLTVKEDFDSVSTQKAESFILDIEEHELPPFSNNKSDSEDTIITSPTHTKALIESQNCFVDYEKSTIPDNTSISEKLRDVENFLESDSGRQSQNNSDSEDDIVNKRHSSEEHSKSKKLIIKKRKTSLKENKTISENNDDKSTQNEIAERSSVKNTKETCSKTTDQEGNDRLLIELSKAISENNPDTGKSTPVEADKNPPPDASELHSSESLSDPPQNAEEESQDNFNKHIEKELRVNLDNIDITPEKFSDEHILQSRDTVRRKLVDDVKGIADDTFIEDEESPVENAREDIDADQESIKSFVFNLRDQDGDFMESQTDNYNISDDDTCETVCGSYSSEGTDLDATLKFDSNNANDVNEDSEITKSPKKLSTESESNKEHSDGHSDICVTPKKNLRKLETDSSDNEGDTELKSKDTDSEKDTQSNICVTHKNKLRKLESDSSDNEGVTELKSQDNDSQKDANEIITPRKPIRKISSDSESKELSDDNEIITPRKPIRKISSDSESKELSDDHSEITYKIRTRPKQLDSDISDRDSQCEVPQKPNSDSENNLPGSISDNENVTELIKNIDTAKVVIELENTNMETNISECDSDVGSHIGDSTIIDDPNSSDDDAFIEISPEEVLIDDGEDSSDLKNNETKEADVENPKTDNKKISDGPSDKDSLEILLEELCESYEDNTANDKSLDNRYNEEAKPSDNVTETKASPRKSKSPQKVLMSELPPEEVATTDIERERDDLLALLGESPQQVSESKSSPGEVETADIEKEKEKDDLLALLDERLNENIELEKQRVENDSEVNKIALLELLQERETDNKQNNEENMEIPQSSQEAKNDSDKNTNIGDKSASSLLYDVMREEEIPDKDSALSPGKRGRRKSELREAEEIYKKLLVEESDVTDVSDSDDDLSSINIDTTDLDSDSSYEELFSLHGLKKCSVRLERIKLDDSLLEQAILNRGESDTDSDIDRLCDINNILKRKSCSSSKKHSRRKRRKKSTGSSCASGLETSKSGSDSDATNASGDSDIMASLGVRPLSFSSTALPMDEDELLADALCEKMSGGSSSASSEDSDDEKKNKKAAKKGSGNKAEEESLSKEELERRAWRKDALLHGNIDTDTESDTGGRTRKSRLNEKIKAKFKKFKSKSKGCHVVSDSDSESTNLPSEDLRDLKNKIDSKSQKKSKIGSDSESSEIEFVAVPRTPKKSKGVINISDDDVETTPTKGKGRRNIRALVSDENLAESTQKAQAEENERIARLEERKKIKETFTQSFASQGGSDEDCLVLDMDKDTLTPLVQVHSVITSRLKPHQKEGVQFMWESCYESVDQLKKGSQGSGCILAHCMGLGKTLQALALIHTIFSYEFTKTKHVLVVCPLSTVPNWKSEFNLAFGKIKGCKIPLHIIHANKNLTAKYEVVRKWYKKGGMLVLGYEAFGNLTNHSKLDKYFRLFKDDILEALVDPGPDLVICDEGHLLRNKSSRRTLSLNKIKTRRRIVLTGTPLQNNLLEYYHMVNFVKPNLLGTEREYKTNFVNPITNGQYEDSTAEDIKLMKCRTHILHRKLKKTVQRVEDTELKIYLPNLIDYGVFIQLHKLQVDIYKTYLEIALSRIEKSKKTFLSDVQILKYVGSHPHVLKSAQKLSNKKIKEEDVIDENDKEKVDEALISKERWWKSLMPEDVADVIEYGNKFQVVMSLIEECENIGDKMLIFSQNYAEMDSLEHFLKIKNPSKWRTKTDYYRMDGTVPPEERTVMCDNFNNKKNKKLRLFIMSTKVGGLGLNLTGANRVIIMNVNWNPSYDTQSVFRTFRFGQEKEVFVYRLISMDTMEEKIYQRQVTKLAIAHRVVDKHQITRHYNSTDILELYTVQPNADDERPVPNLPTDAVLAKVLQKHAFIFRWHEHQQLLANRPEEDLNEAEKNAAWEEFNRKATEPPLTIHPPFPSFGPNVAAIQRPGFLMASMLPHPTAAVASTSAAFLTGTNLPSSSVANMKNLPNNMKINSLQGLDSPSSEDHDYCLPKPSPFSAQAKQPTTVSAQPSPIQNSTVISEHSTPNLNTMRKLIFSHNSNLNITNPTKAQFNKHLSQVKSNSLNPPGRSVLVSSSQGKVIISSAANDSTVPSTSTTNVKNCTTNLAARPATLNTPTKVTNNINSSTINPNPVSVRRPFDAAQALYLSQMKSNRIPVPPLIKYPNTNITPSAPSKPINPSPKSGTERNKNNKEQDPLFIDPKLVGSSVPVAMSYKEAVSLAEKWSSAKKKTDSRAVDPLRKVQKAIQKRTPTHSPKFNINPSSSVSNIHQQMANNFSNIVNSTNIRLKNRPAVSLTQKSSAVSGIPTKTNVLTRKPVGIEVSKIPAGPAKKSNKENKKVPSSLINLVDDDVIPVPSGPPNSASLSNNEIVKNLKEISINKVQKDKNAKNVIRLD